MTVKNQRKLGIILSYILLILDTAISIVYTPILLKALGDGEYGLYQLIGSLVNYFAIMDFGLGGTITRYIIKYETEKKQQELKNFFAMALIVYSAVCLVILVAGTILGFNIGVVFQKLSDQELHIARILFAFLIINLIVTLFDHAYSGVLQAYEQFGLDKGLRIVRVLIRAVAVIVFLHFYKSSIVIVSVDLILTILILAIKVWVAHGKLQVKPKLIKWNNSLFKEVFGFTLAIFLQAIINQFNNNVDKTVLGIYTTTSLVAVYSVAMQIFSAYSGISTAVQSVYLPKISRVVFEGGDNHSITESLIEPSRMQFAALSAVCIGFWLYGYEFIDLWCGKTDAWLIACIVMTAGTVELFQNSTTSVLKAKNLLHGRTIINLVTALANFAITLTLVPKYGMLGAAAGTAFTLIVGYIVINNIYYKCKVGIEVGFYFKKVLERLLVAACLGGCIGALPKLIHLKVSWISFCGEMVWFIVTYSVIIFFVGLTESEKNKIKSLIFRH